MPDLLHTLHVDLVSTADDRSYPIDIGRGLIGDAATWQRLIADRGVVLVTDDHVGPLYSGALTSALGGVAQPTEVVLPDPIGNDSAGQWIVFSGDRTSQSESSFAVRKWLRFFS